MWQFNKKQRKTSIKFIKQGLFLFLCCILLLCKAHEGYREKRNIIILTGPSCAGKSSLSLAMREMFPDEFWNYINFGSFRQRLLVDKAIELELVPPNYINENNILLDQDVQKSLAQYNEPQAKEKREAWTQAFAACDKAFSEYLDRLPREHKNIIIDIPLYRKSTLSFLLDRKWENCRIFFVLAHTTFEKLAERVQTRNSLYTKNDYRYINQVIYRYFLYYTAEKSYSENSLGKLSKKKIHKLIMKWTEEQESFLFLPTKNELADQVGNLLGFTQEEELFLVPRLNYDYVLNTSSFTPEEAAINLRDAMLKFNGNTIFFENTIDALVS